MILKIKTSPMHSAMSKLPIFIHGRDCVCMKPLVQFDLTVSCIVILIYVKRHDKAAFLRIGDSIAKLDSSRMENSYICGSGTKTLLFLLQNIGKLEHVI